MNIFLSSLFFYTWLKIGKTISSNLSQELLMEKNLIPALDNIFYIHSVLITVPILLMIYSIFFKFIKKIWIVIILGISFIFPVYEWLDNYVHPFLFNLHIYDWILVPGQKILNPQYTKITFYISLIFILIFLVMRKKTRSLDRIFILLMSISVLLTTFLFHMAIPSGFFKIIRQETYHQALKDFNQIDYETNCKNHQCVILNEKSELEQNLTDENNNYLNYSWFYKKGIETLEKTNESSISSLLNNFQGQRFDYDIGIVKKLKIKEKIVYLFFIDNKSIRIYSRTSEIWFSFLTACAHSIWIFGSIFLIFFHKYKIKNRALKQKTI